MPKRNTFSREFKLEAIRQMEAGDKKASDRAHELGVPRNKLYLWREELKAKDSETAFPGSGRRSGKEAELAALKQNPALKGMTLLQRGNRLSILPVAEKEWKAILKMV